MATSKKTSKKINKDIQTIDVAEYNLIARPVVTEDIENVYADRFAKYGLSTVISRAIPSIEDGLNPVTRRILHIFNSERNTTKFRKAAYFVGMILGS